LPGLTRFVEQLEEGEYVLLAVCVDNERPSKISDFLQAWGEDMPVYLDPGGLLARRYGTIRFPETYILGPDGVVCRKVIGAGNWNMSEWAHILHRCAGKNDNENKGSHADS